MVTRLRLILAFVHAILHSVKPGVMHAYWSFEDYWRQYRLDVYDRMGRR